jgi:hypothetical protein
VAVGRPAVVTTPSPAAATGRLRQHLGGGVGSRYAASASPRTSGSICSAGTGRLNR